MLDADINYGRVTIVEDDLELSHLTADYLKQNGFSVTEIHNGLDAIESITQHNADIVLLDLMLPGTDGINVCRKIRSHFFKPIIFLTARDDDIDEITALEVGADGYLVKPVIPRKLVAYIKANLRRKHNSDDNERLINQNEQRTSEEKPIIEFDEINQRANVEGNPIKLSQPEFKILKCLVEHQDKVLDRDQLMQSLQGIEYDGLSRRIDIIISDLRKLLPNPELIKTVRGKGYCWNS